MKYSPTGFQEDSAPKSLIVGIGHILRVSTRIREVNQWN